MSGLPGGEPGSTRPNWIVNAWNSAALDVLDYQWQIAADFCREADRLARSRRPMPIFRDRFTDRVGT